MITKTLKIFSVTLCVVAVISCGTKDSFTTVKTLPSDPFKNTIAESQFFEIDAKMDNVVEGDDGVIILCPKGSFVDASGDVVEGNIKIELVEGVGIEDMVLSNLTTTSNGRLLETGGMIYFNATSEGEQLFINKNIPVHIEIPTPERKAGMMAYKGVRDENGNMNWVDPKPLDKYLKTVDINSLDFLPLKFKPVVEAELPFRNHKTMSQTLVDSLYYSLSVTNGKDLIDGVSETNVNEAYYNKDRRIVDKKYTKKSYRSYGEITEEYYICDGNYGIDPASIKVIKSEKYQNTFIATKEFETRLQAIFSSCDSSILELYVKNLDKNLFEIDSLAAIQYEKNKRDASYHTFFDFSQQRLTNVRHADKIAAQLNGYYESQIRKVTAELEKNKQQVLKELANKNAAAQKIIDKYQKLLWKREKYRMETYGFDWTETGWVNVDNGTLPKWWGDHNLEVNVTNGKQFDRVYTYVIFTSIKSLYRLNSTDSVNFYVGNASDKQMLMPKEGEAVVIAIGYKDEEPSISINNFELASVSQMSVSLMKSNLEEVRSQLSKYDRYTDKNRISTDLEFMSLIYKEQQRQKKLEDEVRFINTLRCIAFPCHLESDSAL